MVGHIRATGILTSVDFDDWTPRKKVVITDAQDGYPFVQFHHLMVSQYGDILIGMADVMHIIANDNKTSTEDVQLICSRDGWTWHRVAERAVFIANGPQAYDREIVSPRSAFVRAGDVIYIYYLGSPVGQGRRQTAGPAPTARHPAGGMCLATLPADRFVALVPATAACAGVVRTRPLTTKGGRLLLNAALSDANDIEVEVLAANGDQLPEFSRQASRLLVHDPLRYHVVWEGGGRRRDLRDAVARRPVVLRFHLQGGALFAFQVTD
jgi:hypothetical protein